MVTLRHELEVARPLDEVFAFIGDFSNTSAWDPGVADARALTDGPIAVGSRYALTVRFGDRKLPMIYEVTRFDPPRLVTLHGSGSTVDAVDDIRFTQTPVGTRIDYVADLRLKGVLRLAEPLVRGRLRKVGVDAMAGMERALLARA